jgi:hypothetical protein
MNFGIDAHFPEIVAVFEIVCLGMIVVAAFVAGLAARGCK